MNSLKNMILESFNINESKKETVYITSDSVYTEDGKKETKFRFVLNGKSGDKKIETEKSKLIEYWRWFNKEENAIKYLESLSKNESNEEDVNESNELTQTQIKEIECVIHLSDKKTKIKLIIDPNGNILNLSDVKKYDGQRLEFREGYSFTKIKFKSGDIWEYENDVPNCISSDYKEMDFELKGKKLVSFNKIDKKQFGYIKDAYEYHKNNK